MGVFYLTNYLTNRLRLALLLVALMLIGGLGANQLAAQTTGRQCFPETNHCVAADFYQYWQTHGALPINGYPLTDEKLEVSPTNGLTYPTQWFERARYERHLENTDPRFRVLLGFLGRESAIGRQFPVTTDTTVNANRAYFRETQHSLSNSPQTGPFLTYWQQNGGLAQFGFPISEPLREISKDNNREYVVQYFERQRFEFHPEQNDVRFRVLLGRLGAELVNKPSNPPPGTPPAIPTLATQSPTAGTPTVTPTLGPALPTEVPTADAPLPDPFRTGEPTLPTATPRP